MQVQKPKQGYKLVKSLFGKYEEIPEDWDIKTVHELLEDKTILEIQDGNHGELHPKQDDFAETGIPFITANCIVDNAILFSKCKFLTEEFIRKLRIGFSKGNDVILTHKGSLGLCAVVPEEIKIIMLSPQTTYYRLSSSILPKFLYYVFQSNKLQNQLFSLGKQSTRDYLGITTQEQLVIPKPSIIEQQKITSILSNVDALIQQTQKELEQTQRLKKGLMQKLLTKGMGHTKFKKVNFFSNKILEVPTEWNIRKINELIKDEYDIKTGPFGSNLLEDELINDGIRVFYPEDIEDYRIYNHRRKCITADKYKQLKNYRVQSGDVIISLMGTIGKVAVIPDNIQDSIISKHLLKITLNKNFCIPQYFVIILSSTLMQMQMASFSQGLTMQGLNTKIIRNLLCIIPSLQEQEKIVTILSDADSEIQKLDSKKLHLQILKKGLNQKLLTGEIRVKV